MDPPISLEQPIMVRTALTIRTLSRATPSPAPSPQTASTRVTSRVPSRSALTPLLLYFPSLRQRFLRFRFPTIKPAPRRPWSFKPIRQRMRGDTCSSNCLSRPQSDDVHFGEFPAREEG